MITVRDEQETLNVGETREELAKYLSETCADSYRDAVLAWFDDGAQEPLHIANGPHWTDEWKVE